MMTKPIKPVYVVKTFTSAAVGVPHIGSKGWMCRSKSCQMYADRFSEDGVKRVCILFRERYDPSDGCPKVPGDYVPRHIFMPTDHVSKKRVGKKRTTKLRVEFAAERKRYRENLAKESQKAMARYRKQMKKLDEMLASEED